MALDAVMIVLSIFLLLGMGMALTHRGWIDAGGAKLLARLTVSVGMPALVLNNVLTQFHREGLASSLRAIAICYLSVGLSVLLGWGAARLIAIPAKRRGAFMCAFSFSNCVFIGLPVAVALFGEEATPYALIYYIANTSLFWSLGNYLLARDGGGKGRLDVKKLIPAPLVAFVLGVAMVLLGLTLPSFVLSACKYLGALVTPLSLLYTGYVVMGMVKAGFRSALGKGLRPRLAGPLPDYPRPHLAVRPVYPGERPGAARAAGADRHAGDGFGSHRAGDQLTPLRGGIAPVHLRFPGHASHFVRHALYRLISHPVDSPRILFPQSGPISLVTKGTSHDPTCAHSGDPSGGPPQEPGPGGSPAADCPSRPGYPVPVAKPAHRGDRRRAKRLAGVQYRPAGTGGGHPGPPLLGGRRGIPRYGQPELLLFGAPAGLRPGPPAKGGTGCGAVWASRPSPLGRNDPDRGGRSLPATPFAC